MKTAFTVAVFFTFVFYLHVNVAAVDIVEKRVEINGSKVRIYSNGNVQSQPKIGLVLSGGGARGLSHIGVLKVLQEHDIPIDLLVGTSIGSVIGGLYASGYSPEEIADITKTINWEDIYRDKTQRTSLFLGQKNVQDRYLLSLRFDHLKPFIPNAFTPGQKVLNILTELFLQAKYQARDNFDNLRVPFRAVSTDLISGKRVVLKDGDLAESINASLAVPLLFSPVKRDSMLLVDGGLKTNLPVDAALEEGMDVVIAVDMTAHLRKNNENWAPWEIVDQATTILSELSNRMQRQKADILITPEVRGMDNTRFEDIDSIIKAGEDATRKKMVAIKRAIVLPAANDRNRIYNVNHISFNFADGEMPLPVYNRISALKGERRSRAAIVHQLDHILNSGNYCTARAEIEVNGDGHHIKYVAQQHDTVTSIDIEGNSVFSERKILSIMFTKAGKPLNTHTLDKDLDRIIELYRRDGYALMEFENVDWDEKSGRLSITIREGFIDAIEIRGNEKSHAYIIRREFSSLKGTIFNWRDVQRAIQNVYGMQLFNKVTVNTEDRGGQNRMVVKVQEKSSVVLHLGGKTDTERKAQAYIEFGDENFLGTGIKTSFLGRIGARDGQFGLTVRDDRIFTTYLTFSLQSYYKWQNNPYRAYHGPHGRYREERRGLRFQAGQQMRRIGQLIAELRLENINVHTLEGNLAVGNEFRLRAFALRAVTDKRNRVDFPYKGIYNHWAWEYGSKLLLDSEESYTKAMINLEGYYTFLNDHTWHLRGFVGVGDKTLPFSENFRIGGLHSFYGLHQNEYYGRQVVVGSVEYRYRLPFHINDDMMLVQDGYLSLRHDLGGIWENPALVFSTVDFFNGLGAALAFDTLLGPLYFAWGKTSQKNGIGYVSLGFNF